MSKGIEILIHTIVGEPFVQLLRHVLGIVFGKAICWSCLQIGMQVDQHNDHLEHKKNRYYRNLTKIPVEKYEMYVLNVNNENYLLNCWLVIS